MNMPQQYRVWATQQQFEQMVAEIESLRAQVAELNADALVRANKQAILIQAMWHIREHSLYYHDREIATEVLTAIGELQP